MITIQLWSGCQLSTLAAMVAVLLLPIIVGSCKCGAVDMWGKVGGPIWLNILGCSYSPREGISFSSEIIMKIIIAIFWCSAFYTIHQLDLTEAFRNCDEDDNAMME
ncbi:uncharacterized protein LOC105664857 [Ceratitis capitata]|uniref:uncharacterized protein LOC105664857 n=1 Tax=Ceratitis capitata TaxID=7213 RepID=UPI0006188232|nr:uncharacterized protein LOC105664857 [Ceratitis capitata]